MIPPLASRARGAGASVLLLAALGGCQGAPDQPVVSAHVLDAGASSPPATITVSMARSFGAEGEVPLGLFPAPPERLWAVTTGAVYVLSLEGRVIARRPLPANLTAATGPITGAAASEEHLGLVARAARVTGPASPRFWALASTDAPEDGVPVPWDRGLEVGALDARPWLSFDGAAFSTAWLAPGEEKRAAVQVVVGARITVADADDNAPPAATPPRTLAALPAGTTAGPWISPGPGRDALCTITPDSAVALWRFARASDGALPLDEASAALDPVLLPNGDRAAAGGCQLATSGRSILVTYLNAARPVDSLDAGAADLGLGTITYPEPFAQLVDPHGQPLAEPIKLSRVGGTVRVENAVWTGGQYLVLLNAAGYRGGRLIVAAMDEGGTLLYRDALIPLTYEPGLLLAARLTVTPAGLFVLYTSQRPWDEGILHLARIALQGAQ